MTSKEKKQNKTNPYLYLFIYIYKRSDDLVNSILDLLKNRVVFPLGFTTSQIPRNKTPTSVSFFLAIHE